MTFARPHARIVLVLSVVATLAMVAGIAPSTATAAPAPTPPPGLNDENAPSLTEQLEQASAGYVTAKAQLDASRKKHAALLAQLNSTKTTVGTLSADANVVAATAYRGGRVSALAVAMDSTSFDTFVERSMLLEQLSWQNAEKLRTLSTSRAALQDQQRKIEEEIKRQQAAEKDMGKRKYDAERALGLVPGQPGDPPLRGTIVRAARASPRAADGSWPREKCAVDDPTTGGCLTKRTYHALLESKAAGFQRFTHCYRDSSSGEHGKGRACDFAAAKNGFGKVAAGDDKDYGNRLAAFLVANADQLGVLYVIWFRRVWMPGSGWRAYSGRGNPSAEHTDHVHLSVL